MKEQLSTGLCLKGMLMRKEAANMNQKKIGSFLKELRKEKGITQEEFAGFDSSYG
jgi:hypothetical protein